MGWTNSKIFVATLEDALENTAAIDLNSDTFKAALFTDAITPDQTVASAATAYGAGVWGTTNEVDDGTNWDAGGEPLTGVSSTFSSNVYTFDATDTPQGGASTTLANVYGTLVYDDTLTTPVADQGLCFCYLGGVNSVTSGTFSLIWHGSGILAYTL